MVRIIRHFPEHRPNDSDNDPSFDEEKPHASTSAEDKFDDLLAGLTRLPQIVSSDGASPQAASPQAAPSQAAPAQAAPAHVAPKAPAPTKLPSVEEFRFDEAAAKNMASKLAPHKKPRIKSRRPHYRSTNRDRWRLPDEPDEHNDEHHADNQNRQQPVAAPRGGGRSLFWSFCVTILIVMGTSAAFGFVQPLNDLLPERVGSFLSGLSGELGASLFSRADTSAEIEVADGNPNSDKNVLSQNPQMASAAVARPVSTTTVTAEVRPPANSSGFGFFEQAEPAAAKSEEASGSGVAAVELPVTYGAAVELAAPESKAPATTPAQAPAAAPAAAASDQANKDAPRNPALQRSAKANPLPMPGTLATRTEPSTGMAQPPALSLPAPEITSLLTRGHEMLQRGDIASARLLFRRVAAAGDRRGARGMGMTYDPDVYARLPVTGLTPDREQAAIWYKKAGENSTFAADRNTIADTPKAQEPGSPGSPEWNADCARKYASFDPGTGLYTAHSGAKRPCQLP
jgi:hypothetical protein